jgi:hypothetical protein
MRLAGKDWKDFQCSLVYFPIVDPNKKSHHHQKKICTPVFLKEHLCYYLFRQSVS